MKTKQTINPAPLVLCEVISLFTPLFVLQNTFINEPQHLKAFISALTAILGWSIFKVLAPQIHQTLLNRAKISNGRYWLLLLLVAMSSLLIVTSLQSIQSVIGKRAEIYIVAGFALEGIGVQWLRVKKFLRGGLFYAVGKTSIILLLASTISFLPTSIDSPFVVVAFSSSLYATLCLITYGLDEVLIAEKLKRALALAFVAPASLHSILIYLGLLPHTFLFLFASMIPLKRFNNALDNSAPSALRNCTVRAAMLFAILFVVIAMRTQG
jgi:hypothetical protein